MSDEGSCEGEQRFLLWSFFLFRLTAFGLEGILIV